MSRRCEAFLNPPRPGGGIPRARLGARLAPPPTRRRVFDAGRRRERYSSEMRAIGWMFMSGESSW
jgi:hypothetical protein